jgi:hypothetical protein
LMNSGDAVHVRLQMSFHMKRGILCLFGGGRASELQCLHRDRFGR